MRKSISKRDIFYRKTALLLEVRTLQCRIVALSDRRLGFVFLPLEGALILYPQVAPFALVPPVLVELVGALPAELNQFATELCSVMTYKIMCEFVYA